MVRFRSALLSVVVIVAAVAALPACPFFEPTCASDAEIAVEVALTGQGGVALEDATVTATVGGVDTACPHIGNGQYACGDVAAPQVVAVSIEGTGYARDVEIDVVADDDDGICAFESGRSLLVDIPEAAGPPCCCASVVEGDIVEEAPADSAAACAAREQGSCVDQATIDQRLTPHACCPDATGERCGD